MSTELIQKLRQPNGILDWEYRHLCADRIEALESEIDIALVTIKRLSDERTAALHLIESLQELLEFYAPIKSTSSC